MSIYHRELTNPENIALARELNYVWPAMTTVAGNSCQHDYGQQPGRDGRIYMVCRKCGHSFAQGGKR